MRGLLEDMPVKVVLNDDCGIMGAARYTLDPEGVWEGEERAGVSNWQLANANLRPGIQM